MTHPTQADRKRTPMGATNCDMVALIEDAYREMLRADLADTIEETRILVRVRADRRTVDSAGLATLERLTLRAIDALAEVC